MRHPDSSLAAFVEGTATARERATAEAHLASCATCRKEVTRARRARSALASLPDVEFQGIDVASVVQRAAAAPARVKTAAAASRARGRLAAEGEVAPPAPFEESLARAQEARAEAAQRGVAASDGATEPQVPATTPPADPTAPVPQPAGPRLVAVSTRGAPSAGETESPPAIEPASVTELAKEGGRSRRRRERDRAWQLRVVQGALGAAAVLVAIVLFVGLRTSPDVNVARDQAETAGGAPTGPAPAAGGPVRDFNVDSLEAYANQQAADARTNDAASLTRESDEIASSPKAGPNAPLEQRAIVCLERDSGLVGGTHLYDVIEAMFEGRPVYVGAFLSGLESDRPVMLVIASSVDGCNLVRLIQVPL
jgi:hypothetical protein